MSFSEQILRLLPESRATKWRQAYKDNPEYQRDGHSVFVYGSLKRGFPNNDILATQEFVAVSRTLSALYRMVSLGYYPAVIEGGPHHIEGEVYLIDGKTLWTLDIMEGKGDFYDRKGIILEGIEEVPWCYFLQDTDPIYHNPTCPMVWIEGETNTQRWIHPLDGMEFPQES